MNNFSSFSDLKSLASRFRLSDSHFFIEDNVANSLCSTMVLTWCTRSAIAAPETSKVRDLAAPPIYYCTI